MMTSKSISANKFNKAKLSGLLFSIALDIAGPFVVYQLSSPYLSDVAALSLAAVLPGLHSLVELVRTRRLNFFSTFILAGIVLSLGLVALGGSARLILVRESLLTGAFGLAFLISILLKRPLIFYLIRHFVTGNNPVLVSRLNQTFQIPQFQQGMMLLTLVYGLGSLLEAGIRTYLAFNLSIPEFLAISPLVQYGILAPIITFQIVYSRLRLKKWYATLKAPVN